MKYYINTFKEIANKENGEFYFTDEDISVGLGVRSPHVTFQLKIPYKDYIVYISNTTGTQYVGKYVCKLPTSLKASEFEIRTKTHLSTLFSINKKNRFKIATQDQALYHFLKSNTSLEILNTVAKTDIFEPIIEGKITESSYVIRVAYHLEFDNWTQVLEPLISFYKELIDFLESKNRNYGH